MERDINKLECVCVHDHFYMTAFEFPLSCAVCGCLWVGLVSFLPLKKNIDHIFLHYFLHVHRISSFRYVRECLCVCRFFSLSFALSFCVPHSGWLTWLLLFIDFQFIVTLTITIHHHQRVRALPPVYIIFCKRERSMAFSL